MSRRSNSSKARLVVELTGPTDAVQAALEQIITTARHDVTVMASYPEPCRIEPVVRVRKPNKPKQPKQPTLAGVA
jgi:hypothetical protein